MWPDLEISFCLHSNWKECHALLTWLKNPDILLFCLMQLYNKCFPSWEWVFIKETVTIKTADTFYKLFNIWTEKLDVPTLFFNEFHGVSTVNLSSKNVIISSPVWGFASSIWIWLFWPKPGFWRCHPGLGKPGEDTHSPFLDIFRLKE